MLDIDPGMGIETHTYTDLALDDPIGIVGFPSVGLVSSIAANYIVSQLKMPAIAGMNGGNIPPYSLISEGIAYPPIRFYGIKSRTKTGRDLIVCTSEFAPKPEDCYEIGMAVLSKLRDLGCRQVICMEGIPRMSDKGRAVVCGSGLASEKLEMASGLPRMDNGMVKGTSGVILCESRPHGMVAATLMCPANPNIPDPGSAVEFLEPLSKMIKGLRIDSKPLLTEAEEIRKKLEADQASVERDQTQNTLYG